MMFSSNFRNPCIFQTFPTAQPWLGNSAPTHPSSVRADRVQGGGGLERRPPRAVRAQLELRAVSAVQKVHDLLLAERNQGELHERARPVHLIAILSAYWRRNHLRTTLAKIEHFSEFAIFLKCCNCSLRFGEQ